MAVEKKKREREKVNDYSGTIVSERRRWRTHTLGPIKETLQTHKIMVHELVGMKVNMAESFKEDKNHFKCKSCGQVFSGPAGKKNLVTHLSKKYKKERFNLR